MMKSRTGLRLIALGLLLMMLISLYAAPVLADPYYDEGTILYVDGKSPGKVHLRAKPSTSSPSLGLYFTGTPVVVERKLTSGWSQVWIGHECGYMMSSYLTTTQKAQSNTATVSSSGYLNLRLMPSQDSESLYRLRSGQQLVLLGETADHWYYVRVPATGSTGYVMSQYVKTDARTATIRHVTNAPFALSEWDGTTTIKHCTNLNVDGTAGGFVALLTRNVTWLSIDTVEWIDDVTPMFTPIYRANAASKGAAYRIRISLPDCSVNIALTCCVDGVFQSWYVTQSGEDGSYLLIPAHEW